MTLIIPGVEVKVVKEVLAPQLAPSGVLGLVGIAELDDKGTARGVARAASWRSFVESAGPAAAFAIPEASPALSNGVFELVVSPVSGATAASVKIPAASGTAFTLVARAPGPWANGVQVQLVTRNVDAVDKDNKPITQLLFDLTITVPGTEYKEVHRNLSAESAQARNVQKVLAQQSQLLRVDEALDKIKEPKAATEPGPFTLADGKDASADQYRAALALLENEPDVDMVLVSVQDQSDLTRLARIYSDVIAHCDRMSTLSQGRIGLGQVPGTKADVVKTASEKLTATLVSDRFVLVAPAGVVGAVAGTLGSLDYFQSPTFKRLAAISEPAPALGVELQQELLKRNVVPVVSQRGRGIIVVRGLTTDGDQISVRRVADHAVRGIKVIGELFIGRLNNEEGRGALKQKLVEFLVQMQKEGAIVPSTDGRDPAFKVNVYSSQDDFAKGIVRVDLAVRPVRAIDYIYATVLVQT
ncbi:MAG TPA: phage tail sheath subtilisin-like domain-containing protein [Chitinolyticbacter sp.]|nr:phage tail sheath subtilisin-like domain-containing protein [Chitinolyticbacter sp.]